MPTAVAGCPTEPIASRARMKHCCVTGVQPSARWRCCGTGANARQVPASSGTEGAIGSIRQFGAWPDNVGKDYSNVCFGVGSCHCRSSLWRSHGEGDRSLKRSEEHTSELQSLMRISYAVFCLKKKT